MNLTVGYTGGSICWYAMKKLKGTLKLEPYEIEPWKQVSLHFEEQKGTLTKAISDPGCPKKVTVSATFGFAVKGGEPGFGEGFNIYGHLV
jgi:hypothetical protein